MTGRRWPILAAGLLLAAGLWQVGGGAYIHAKAWLAQALLERAWEERLAGAPADRAKPWPWADTVPVARLQVPRLGIDRVVLAGASGRTLAFGPAHLAGTAAPGAPGTSVVTGHRDTHFRFLKDLRAGDTVTVHRPDGGSMTYRVSGTGIFDSRTARLATVEGVRALTLVTCYPFDSVRTGQPLRFAVFAREARGPALRGASR